MKALQHLNKYFLKYKFRFALGILFVIISNIFGLYPASIIGEAFDAVGENIKNYQENQTENSYSELKYELLIYGGLVIGLALMKGVFMFFMRQTVIVMSRMIEFDLKNEIYQQYQNLSLAFYKRNNTGDLMNRISEDVSRVRMYLGPAIMYTINLLVMLVLVVSKMISVNTTLTIYVLLPLPILSVTIYYVSNLINVKSEAVQRKLSELSTFVQEAFSGIRVLKSYVREDYSTEQYDKASESYRQKNLELVKINALFFPLMILLIGISTITTIYIGGKEVIAGNISSGNIAEFVIYVNMLTWPVASIGWVTSIVQRAAASQERINEFLKLTPEIQNTGNYKEALQGDIVFDKVSFRYPDTGILALDKLSFRIKPGETLAIVGKTGSGKSTIAQLISRLYHSDSGEIRIDNQVIQDIDLFHLRNAVGVVPQESFLFSDSIANNIGFSITEQNMDLIIEAAKAASVYDNIIDFKEGFETRVGERGITLSGGQKQRIAIARAIIKKPDILIFDDCLSAVDTETEESILKHLKVIMKDRSSLIISHRISSIKHADQILVLDSGKVIEQGTHQELLEINGTYLELYNQQLAEEENKV